jgi:spore germination cell wall hydrolase CwlJ-like protein
MHAFIGRMTLLFLCLIITFFLVNKVKLPDFFFKIKEELQYEIFANDEPPQRTQFYEFSAEEQKELRCLAENIYFEARGEPFEGMLGVAFVTLNRVKDERYPNTICGVVKQKKYSTCQFSWWCEERPRHISRNQLLTKYNNLVYNDILQIAIMVTNNYGKFIDPTLGALFYHADYVNPRWRHLQRVTKIGKHIFYIERPITTAMRN